MLKAQAEGWSVLKGAQRRADKLALASVLIQRQRRQ